MLRASNYNIIVPVENQQDEYLLVHGYSGAIDVVSNDIAQSIIKAKENPESLKVITEDNLDVLKDRGYVTELSNENEKKLFSEISSKMHKVAKRGIALTIVPTYNCNFRCTYCFERGNFSKGNELLGSRMDTNVVDDIFNSIKRIIDEGGVVDRHINLFGGEPLLKSNYEIIKYIVDKGQGLQFKFSAITNGYDLDYYEDLLEKGKISKLHITLDGLEDYHDKRRFLMGGKPSFQKIVGNIDLALSKGIKVSVRTNIDQSNINQIDKLFELYKAKDWISNENFGYYFKSVRACGIDVNNIEDIKDMDDTKIMAKLSKIVDENKFKFNSIYSRLNDMLTYLLKNKKMLLINAEFCGSMRGMIVIDPYRDLYPCWEVIGQKEHTIGKLEEGMFVFNDNINFWQDRSVEKIQKCSECAYALFCGGGCPHQAMLGKGSIYSPYCEKFINIFNEVLPEVYKKCFNGSGC